MLNCIEYCSSLIGTAISVSLIHSSPLRIRVRERLPRPEAMQKPSEQSPDRQQTNRHRQGNTALVTHSEPTFQRTAPQPAHGQTAYPPHQAAHVMDPQPYLSMPAPVATTKVPGPPEVQNRRRVSADQIYASHREARLEARQALKEEAHTEGLLKSRKAVLPSEIRRREKSVDDPQRGRNEEMEWESYSAGGRRTSRAEEDCDKERSRETGRERVRERTRERGREHHRSSHDSQEERIFRSMEPSHSSPRQQPRHQQILELMHQQEAHVHHQEPQKRQYGTQIHQQDSQRLRQHDSLRYQEGLQRQHESQRQQALEIQSQEPQRLQQDSQKKQQEHQLQQEPEPQRPQQELTGQQRSDSAVYLQKGSCLPQARHRGSEISGGPKPKIRTRSMSDIGVSQRSAVYRSMERAEGSRETAMMGHYGRDGGVANGEVGALDTRVSVAQLRHSYLENANRKPEL